MIHVFSGFSPQAKRFFDKADAALQKRLDRCFDHLRRNPRQHPNIKPLQGEFRGHYRFRLGDYRVIYSITEARQVVIVAMIGHRREIYD